MIFIAEHERKLKHGDRNFAFLILLTLNILSDIFLNAMHLYVYFPCDHTGKLAWANTGKWNKQHFPAHLMLYLLCPFLSCKHSGFYVKHQKACYKCRGKVPGLWKLFKCKLNHHLLAVNIIPLSTNCGSVRNSWDGLISVFSVFNKKYITYGPHFQCWISTLIK